MDFAAGAARFTREEGTWVSGERIYFDCTDGGDAGHGQVWEYDTARQTLTLIYESEDPAKLDFPDNLTVAPTGDIFLCENGDPPDFIRGLTPQGRIFDFAKAVTNPTEFAGACFSADGSTLFLNQNGDRDANLGVTYAIWGPFTARAETEDLPPSGGGGGGGERPGARRDPGRRGASKRRNVGDSPDAGGGVAGGQSADGLPFTGLSLGAPLGAAGLLIAFGALLRRRLAQIEDRDEVEPPAGGQGPAAGG